MQFFSWKVFPGGGGMGSDACSPLFFSAPCSSSVWQRAPALSERWHVSPPPALPLSGRFWWRTVWEGPMPGWLLRGSAIQPAVPPPPARGPDSPADSAISHPLPAGHPGPNITLRGTLLPRRHSPRGLQSWLPVRGHTMTEKKYSLDVEEKNETFFLGNHKVFYSVLCQLKLAIDDG